MGILTRFTDIMKSNINALLDKCEDPAKMIDQTLRDLREDLAEVKKETANIIADAKSADRQVQECEDEIAKYTTAAQNALKAGNEDDARTLIAKKQQYESNLVSYKKTQELTHANADKMRQMHDKLVNDIETLEARRDAIKDYRPEIPLSPIKQPVKPYMPTQQPVLSSDNRTGWEKEVSRQIKADKAKNDKLYGNQHTWNWSAPFTNARITKDNASAIFDFDKSAAMSTFAIGQGIASPVTTATSIAGSLVGAGIGNKVAGEKGALVGGFVGGMVNPRFRFGKSSSTKRREHGNVADNVNLHSKMNFDDYDQIVNAIDNEEELYRLYLQNETVAKRIREVSPSYVKEVNNFIKTKIKKRFGKPTNGNYQAANRVADDAPEVTFGGVPFKYQENVYNIEPGKPIPHLEFVAHENSHGIDRAVSRLLSTDYLRNLLNPSDKLPFNKWINEVKKSKAVVDYIKRSRNLDVNNPADYSKIEKEVYKYFSDPTEIKAYFSRIPFEKYKKSVDRSFDGKVINNPVSKDIFQITDADILDDVRLQLIASIYKRNDMASYEALKSNLTNKLWGVSALGIPAINTLINGYE